LDAPTEKRRGLHYRLEALVAEHLADPPLVDREWGSPGPVGLEEI
jgi:hypothetical protein